MKSQISILGIVYGIGLIPVLFKPKLQISPTGLQPRYQKRQTGAGTTSAVIGKQSLASILII